MAIVTFSDGSVVSLSVFSTLPEKFPFAGQSSRVEILGAEGVMLFDEDHKEHLLYTDRGFPQSYVSGLITNMGYLSSTDPGDWALGDFWGPLANETRAWLDYQSMGRPCALATGEDGRTTLEVTLAIEQSAQIKKAVTLPLPVKG
jgi:predicted dehydrogenase